jgi:hypothetical protein
MPHRSLTTAARGDEHICRGGCGKPTTHPSQVCNACVRRWEAAWNRKKPSDKTADGDPDEAVRRRDWQ